MTVFALPTALRRGIDDFASNVSGHEIAARTEKISENYAKHNPTRSAITDNADVAAYLTARCPATFAACVTAFSALAKRAPSLAPLSVLDIGAGPGTASWAAVEQWPNIETFTMADENEGMLSAARILCAGAGHPALREARTRCAVISRGLAEERHDLVVASYAIGELAFSDMRVILPTLWRSAHHALVLIEPGTPEGFARINAVREILIKAGAEIAAPCPHSGSCPILAPDWCHFSQRLPRSRDHMRAKGARLPFEDEKFSYVAATRDILLKNPEGRIIDRPKAGKLGMQFRLCGEMEISERQILRRDKLSYRALKHRKWGDTLPI